MTPTNPTALHRVLSTLATITAGGLLLWLAEILDFFYRSIPLAGYGVSATGFLAGGFALTVGLFVLHVFPLWGLGALLSRWTKAWLPWVVLAGLFALSWQQTLLQGDGVRALPYFTLLQVGLAILAPALLMALVWAVGLEKLIPRRISKWVVMALLPVALWFNFNVLLSYTTFHGHLSILCGVVFAWLLYPHRHHRILIRALPVAGLAFVVTTSITVANGEQMLRYLQRFSTATAAMMQVLPAAQLVQYDADRVILFDREWTDEEDAAYEAYFEERVAGMGEERYGSNVMLVVLETVRWDDWNDEEIAPRFHEWKERGLYLPNAVSQYPATPLAYGALFMSQPPSVLATTSYWGRDNPFKRLTGEFDELILTKPDVSWFEKTAITDFFLPRHQWVNAHESSETALEYARARLEQLSDEERFFGWVHLYEPHAAYELREEFALDADDDGDEARRAYRSEISYLDHHLGHFIDWFYEQPYAEDTLLIVVADHGEGFGDLVFGEGFRGHHVHVHNVVSRIPMFFAGPGIEPAQIDEKFATTQMDVLPTVFDFVGQDLPVDFYPQGDSLYRMLHERPDRLLPTEAFNIRGGRFFDFVEEVGESEDPESLRKEFEAISTEASRYSPKLAIQYGDHKLIYDRVAQQYWLFNIADDPYEQDDLSKVDRETLMLMIHKMDQWILQQSWVVQRLNRR